MPENNNSQAVSNVEKKGSQPFRARAFDGYQPTRSLDKSNPPRGRVVVQRPAAITPVKKTAKG